MTDRARFLKILGCLTLGLFLAIPFLSAQPPAGPNRGVANLTLDGKTISINYGRPALKGRDLSNSVAVGTVWRFGMNEATVLKTDADLYTCCGVLKAGSYSLWAKKVGENKWELIFNSQTGKWGTDHDPLKDLISVPMKVETSKDSAEQVTITLVKTAKGGEIRCAWGTQLLAAEFSNKP